jgi:hypothetical protein
MNATIADAIRTKKVLSLTYDGMARVVEPHAYGVSSTGSELLRCYQVGGDHRENGHNWDMLTVSKIVGLVATGATFYSAREGYWHGDKKMARVYVEL